MHGAYMHFGRYCNYYGSCGLWCARSFHHNYLEGICPMDRTDLRRRAFLCSSWILRLNNAISYSHWSCRHGETSSNGYYINCSHRLHNNSCNQFSLWQRLQTLYTPLPYVAIINAFALRLLYCNSNHVIKWGYTALITACYLIGIYIFKILITVNSEWKLIRSCPKGNPEIQHYNSRASSGVLSPLRTWQPDSHRRRTIFYRRISILSLCHT